MAANIGLSKVFILDKYFKELQKFWETEKKLQGEWLDVKKCRQNFKFSYFYSQEEKNVKIEIENNNKSKNFFKDFL